MINTGNIRRSNLFVLAMLLSGALSAGALTFNEKGSVDIPSASARADSAFIAAGPYIQNTTADAVTIMWQQKQAKAATLRITGGGETKHYAVAKAKRLNEIRVTGLAADTEYTYRIVVPQGASGASREITKSGTFRTFPVKPRAMKFVVYGDTRSNPDRHKSVIDAMAREEGIEFVLHTGDVIDSGRNISKWIPGFFQPAAPMIRKVPFYIVMGNHEDNSPYYFQYFDFPGNERWYSFDYPDIHVIGLDSGTDFEPGSAQYKWLISDLEKNKNVPWKFVFFHHPVYTSGSHGKVNDSGLPAERPIRAAQAIMPALARKYGITAFFGGHDHAYERSDRDGVRYIVAGGGGAPSYGDPNAKHNKYRKVFYSGLHYCMLSIDGTKGHIVVKSPAGKVIDDVDLKAVMPAR